MNLRLCARYMNAAHYNSLFTLVCSRALSKAAGCRAARGPYKKSRPFNGNQNTDSAQTRDTASSPEDKKQQLRKWTLATAPRVEPAPAEDPARALTAPAPPARRAAAHAAHLAAANVPLAAFAKGRRVTPAAVSEAPVTLASSALVMEPVYTLTNVFSKCILYLCLQC
ncbi:hypothetical protein ABVT39_005371 [Epinephelus coioides]